MIILQNEHLEISIHELGAEMQRLHSKKTGLEYLWDGNPEFWPRHSPVLFPIVGSVKDDHYIYGERQYKLPRHGFARDFVFAGEQISETEALFTLKSNEASKAIYPFDFVLKLRYTLEGASVSVQYEVENPAEQIMYFSIGAHPAFRLPLVDGTEYSDYYLEFDKPITAGRLHMADGGLLNPQQVPYLDNQQQIPLTKELFAQDAIVLTSVDVDTVSIKSNKTAHGLTLGMTGWPDLGVWAAPGAPFVCIEPWFGFSDFPTHTQLIEQKVGILSLDGKETWQHHWSVTPF